MCSVVEREAMDMSNEHQESSLTFPANIRVAHEHSSKHRVEIMGSSICGCFYCTARYPLHRIVDWIDEDAFGQGQTAPCPYCGIDSVIGDKSGFEVSPQFLAEMRAYWF